MVGRGRGRVLGGDREEGCKIVVVVDENKSAVYTI